MREVNNSTGNINSTNFPKIDSKKEIPQVSETPTENSEPVKVTDNLANSPEAIIGRSQVNKADSLENDMKILLNNPDVVEKTLNFCGLAEQILREKGDDAPYEKASELAQAFKDEFLTK